MANSAFNIETYGVSFEGFEPSCGWPMYKHTEGELIPYLKNEVVRWRERRDAAANERSALRGLKADLAYYRQIKADIAAVGVEEALRHSSRKITPPANDMP